MPKNSGGRADLTNGGKYEKHPWGLCHMSGNVRQWCENTYFGDRTSIHVIRGGGWNNYARDCRAAYRDGHTSDFKINYLGFRVALVQSGQ